MTVLKETVLEDSKEKLTKFTIVPLNNQEQQAITMLKQQVNLYTLSIGRHNVFQCEGNPYYILVLEVK